MRRLFLTFATVLTFAAPASASGVYAPLDVYQDVGVECGAFPSVMWRTDDQVDVLGLRYRMALGQCVHVTRGLVDVEYACNVLDGQRWVRFGFHEYYAPLAKRLPC